MVRASFLSARNLMVVATLALASTAGCMVDDSTDTPATGGTAGAGGSSGAMAGAGGAMAGAGGTAVTCMPNPSPLACAPTKAPTWGEPPGMTPGVLIDFATYATDDSGKWGASAKGQLTGGTSRYHGPNDTDLTATAESGSLRLTGTITATGYVGVVFWFGPCVDASAFTGITFSVGGTTGGAVMKAQIQTHEDYPVDVANSKGGCSFTNCDQRFTECAGPTYQLVVPVTPEPVDLPWSSFAGGTPTPEVTPAGLVGLQYQLECQSDTACTFDITLGSVTLTIAPT
jgi:hypothetical protein